MSINPRWHAPEIQTINSSKWCTYLNWKVLILFLLLQKTTCCRYSLELPNEGTSNEYPQHIIFLLLHKNLCCGYSSEVPHWGASKEYPQYIFLQRNKKNKPVHDKTYDMTHATNEDSDQPAHPCSLTSLCWSHEPSTASRLSKKE